MKKIKQAVGPVVVYSNFKEYGGLRSFVKVLEGHGFSNYNEFGEGRKRFAIWSGDESIAFKDEVKAVYNQLSNKDGSKLRVLLLSPSAKEGLSLFNVRQMHILEPYWNNARLEQIIGRAIRYCSHKNLPEDERNVKVYIYIAVHPDETETVDQYIKKLAFNKNVVIEQFNTALKEAAVDCHLFKHANVHPGEHLKCSM